MDKEIRIPFNIKTDWQFERILHNKSQADNLRLKNNTQKYIMWLWAMVKGAHGKPLAPDEQYTMMGFHMSLNNINYLVKRIGAWEGLSYAPVYDEELNDDEILILYCVEKTT